MSIYRCLLFTTSYSVMLWRQLVHQWPHCRINNNCLLLVTWVKWCQFDEVQSLQQRLVWYIQLFPQHGRKIVADSMVTNSFNILYPLSPARMGSLLILVSISSPPMCGTRTPKQASASAFSSSAQPSWEQWALLKIQHGFQSYTVIGLLVRDSKCCRSVRCKTRVHQNYKHIRYGYFMC